MVTQKKCIGKSFLLKVWGARSSTVLRMIERASRRMSLQMPPEPPLPSGQGAYMLAVGKIKLAIETKREQSRNVYG